MNEKQARLFIQAAQAGEVDEVDLVCLVDNPEAWMLESSTDVAREMIYQGDDATS